MGYRPIRLRGRELAGWPTLVMCWVFVAAGVVLVPASLAEGAEENASGEFTALTPDRVLDTRTGNGRGGATAPLGENRRFDVQITGRGGVPSAGVSAVVMNVTVTEPTRPSYLTVWPSGIAVPEISNLNYLPGQTVPNLVTVAVGAGGQVSVLNRFGTTHVIFDVVGFYSNASGQPGSRFHSIDPYRYFDTRDGSGGVGVGPVGSNSKLRFKVTGVGGVPASGVTGVVMNVTITEPTHPSYLTVYPGDVSTPPTASNLNFLPRMTVPNLVTVRVPANGVIDFYNRFGTVHVIADVVGYYDDDKTTEAGRMVPLSPARALDTRWDDSPLGADSFGVLVMAGEDGVPTFGAGGVVLNVTVAEPTAPSFLTVFSDDLCVIPTSSNLNFVPGQVVPNQVIVRLSTGSGACARFAGAADFYNLQGTVHVIVDVFGYFTDASVEPEFVQSDWSIALDAHGPGVHGVAMIADVSPLVSDDLQDFGGSLRWNETEIDLCTSDEVGGAGIEVRFVGDGFLRIGDGFQTNSQAEGCPINDAMQTAFDDFGLPDAACLFVQTSGIVTEYCAPLNDTP